MQPAGWGRFRVEGEAGAFLGCGRIILLERIREHGSISAAARSMKMSCCHAWEPVHSMNRQSPSPVVEKDTGGRGAASC